MRVTVFQVNALFKEVAMGDVVNNSNRPVQGFGEISVGPSSRQADYLFAVEIEDKDLHSDLL